MGEEHRRILVGPWKKVSLYLDNRREYATTINQLLSLERHTTILLVEDWETVIHPNELAYLLFLKQATITYTSDKVLRLPIEGTWHQ